MTRTAYNPTASAMTITPGNGGPEELWIELFAEPVAQERPRFRSHAQKFWVYDPCASQKQKARKVIIDAMTGAGISVPFLGPEVKVKLFAVFACETLGKDSDNLLKFIMDALEGAAYHDDKMVYRHIVDKIDENIAVPLVSKLCIKPFV